MNRIVTVIFACFVGLSLAASVFANNAGKVAVEIDYGNLQPVRHIEASLRQGQTVLELMQTIATVETHPVGEYIFVTSIDGVAGKRGEMAWYYTVDGSSAEILAAQNVLNDSAALIRWTYQKDVCSCTVDGQGK